MATDIQNSGNISLPWSAKFASGADGAWGAELDFTGMSAGEGQALLRFFQHYGTLNLPANFPRLAAGSHQQAVAFLFPPAQEQPRHISAPVGKNAVVEFRNVLAVMAGALHAGGLGLWLVDPRLVFLAGGECFVIPPFWMPAFVSRPAAFPGIAPEWRGCQTVDTIDKADMYAIARACFWAATAEQHNPQALRLPGEINPAAEAWDSVLAQALRDNPLKRPADLAEWMRAQPRRAATPAAPQAEEPAETPRQPRSAGKRNARNAEGVLARGRRTLFRAARTSLAATLLWSGTFFGAFLLERHLYPPEPPVSEAVQRVIQAARNNPVSSANAAIGAAPFPSIRMADLLKVVQPKVIVAGFRELRRNSLVGFRMIAVLMAAVNDNVPELQWLKERGVDVHVIRNGDGITAAQIVVYAAAAGNALRALQWAKENGANLNVVSKEGWTAAHIAAENDNAHVLEWLKDNGADFSIRSDDGKTPEMMAKPDGAAARWFAEQGGGL